jgi:hypothetical protein
MILAWCDPGLPVDYLLSGWVVEAFLFGFCFSLQQHSRWIDRLSDDIQNLEADNAIGSLKEVLSDTHSCKL